jgi:lipoprotein-anchoring transpeptidase ErfK/SrfK
VNYVTVPLRGRARRLNFPGSTASGHIAAPWLLAVAAALIVGTTFVITMLLLPSGRQPLTRAISTSGVEIDDRSPATIGVSTDESRAYVYGRQLTYYRTTHPAGTIIIDKVQRFLYLIKSNVSAVRYGIGIGRECFDLPALMRVTRKVTENDSSALGSRLVFLDSNARLIHGTTRPDTIGHSVWLGCVRLVNEDVSQIYDNAAIGGRVVVTN